MRSFVTAIVPAVLIEIDGHANARVYSAETSEGGSTVWVNDG